MLRWIYNILRSIVFTAILVAAGIFVIAYILISLPAFNNKVKDTICSELSQLTGGTFEIESLRLSPFNEVVVHNMKVYDPQGDKCIEIETVGAGISLWKLLTEGRIELTYGEIIGLNATIEQVEKDGDFNITFLIDAFSPKDKNKEKTHFELALRNVVLRKSSVSLRRPWLDGSPMIGRLNPADIEIEDLNADITFPKISDTGVEADLRRLSLALPGLTELEKLAFKGSFSPEGIFLNNLDINLPTSRIFIHKIDITVPEGSSLAEQLKKGHNSLEITDSYITPSDFSFLAAQLGALNDALPLHISIDGNTEDVHIKTFSLGNPAATGITFTGSFSQAPTDGSMAAEISGLEAGIHGQTIAKILAMGKALPEKTSHMLDALGEIRLSGDLKGEIQNKALSGNLKILSAATELMVDGSVAQNSSGSMDIGGTLEIEKLHLETLIPSVPLQNIAGNIEIASTIGNKDLEGSLNLEIDNFVYRHKEFRGLTLSAIKRDEALDAKLAMNNEIGKLTAELRALVFQDHVSDVDLDCSVRNLNLSPVADMKKFAGYIFNADINLQGEGRNIDDMVGKLKLSELSMTSPDKGKRLSLDSLILSAEKTEEERRFELSGPGLDVVAEGNFKFDDLKLTTLNIVASIFPALIKPSEREAHHSHAQLNLTAEIKPDPSITEFFNLPYTFLTPASLNASINGSAGDAHIDFSLPYLQKGRDKLIYDTGLTTDIDGSTRTLTSKISITFPIKRGDLRLDVGIQGANNHVAADIDWKNTDNETFNGVFSIEGDIIRNHLSSAPSYNLFINPSLLNMGEADWRLNRASISINPKRISVNDLKLWHDNQFVEIDGVASESYSDVVRITLEDIDVNYIFETLDINYVTFGGVATGEIAGHSLLSSDPIAETESLHIRDFSYNGVVLGECEASSRWNNTAKEIEINADIFNDSIQRVKCRGGIWLGRDSLSFDINANKVPVAFIQPFMSVFSSHVDGIATGDIKLFGTFRDIDMTGRIFADSVAVKLDYTNTVYHGSDSVILDPGRIVIPSFRLYDRNGHSALLTGELTHRYFHDPSFTFRLNDADNLLCYDTSAEINPDWYGVLYGSGTALVRGVPGLVNISADMSLTDNSAFTFVLNDRQYAQDYQFLKFTDKRGEARKALEEGEPDFKAIFKKRVSEESGGLSKFGIDIRATVTPQVLFTLVMDPAAGDKITARGRGAMQVKYESDDDEMLLYGKYELDEGNYNFSLQDIILRDFKIKPGSSISFNGNPLGADLDISAAYRVNTNLSDLDKSFSSDRDLARTNVPVDAILSVEGNMQHPDITFDIELPTLTQDVERKVKSIISTDDMMNRQIIYLLALNRFYTPEYMGSSGNGGELAAVASSTISSQLSNMLGQLTDKVSVSPSFRSDKGDFSDIEVDVALSSRLLNNRLLINGNFGYRDRSNSSTTFVGDFDVEYLLSKNGNLRLKAYNHFNDQNYYLREALTTQGLGVVFRKDFDNLFQLFGKKKQITLQPEASEPKEEQDAKTE